MATTPLPAAINDDTLPVHLVRIGTPLKGDGQLHILGGMPLRKEDVVSEAAISAAHTTAGFSAADSTAIINQLRKRKATKA